MRYKGIIFDMDGTLIDSLYAWEDLASTFLNRYGIEAGKEVKEIVENMTSRESANYFIERYKLDLTVKEVLEEYDDIIKNEYENNIKEKPGVKNYLKELRKKGLKLCVLTLSNRRLSEIVLSRLNLIKYFDFIMCADELRLDKRSSEIYLKAAKKLNLKVEEVLVYEDSLYCLRSAKEGGFTTVGVYDKYSELDEKKIIETSDYYIRSYKDLKLDIIDL